MAKTLKEQYGEWVLEHIAERITNVFSAFDVEYFKVLATQGYTTLEFSERAQQVCNALIATLPCNYMQAVNILIQSLPAVDYVAVRDQKAQHVTVDSVEQVSGIHAFVYWPYSMFIERCGVGDFATSMQAMHALTQRFTAEFCIRPFIERYPEACMELLMQWRADPSHHVRRLVSEGTRPRLPWAKRLNVFEHTPEVVLDLLRPLLIDVSDYVRRSAANHLNDLTKMHAEQVLVFLKEWVHQYQQDADYAHYVPYVVRHALRTLVKQGVPDALALLGVDVSQQVVDVAHVQIHTLHVRLGEDVVFSAELQNTSNTTVHIVVDFVVHYVRAQQKVSEKVFKLAKLDLSPQGSYTVHKRVAMRQMTTRQHYAGTHRIQLMVNGKRFDIGSFELMV